MFKNTLIKLIRALGYEVVPRDGRHSLGGVLRHSRQAGISPGSVIDVGAAYGDFARTCSEVFPDPGYLLIEPLDEYGADLAAVADSIADCRLIAAAASSALGELDINVHPDRVGSSLYLEDEDSDVNGVPRKVRATTLDHEARENGLVPPSKIRTSLSWKCRYSGSSREAPSSSMSFHI